MPRRTENRIWRGVFLATLIGVGLGAATSRIEPRAVALEFDRDGVMIMLKEDGSVYRRAHREVRAQPARLDARPVIVEEWDYWMLEVDPRATAERPHAGATAYPPEPPMLGGPDGC